VKKFPELHRREFVQFLERFCMAGSLKFRNNKWIGLTRGGKAKPYQVKQLLKIAEKYNLSLEDQI